MQMIRKALATIEPWYNWGTLLMERMDCLEREGRSVEGPVGYFELQWCRLHFQVQLGCLPRKRVADQRDL